MQQDESAMERMALDHDIERGERERQLLCLLVRGEQDIAAGIGYDLDDVLAEVESLLLDE